jgi:hypothetical protein
MGDYFLYLHRLIGYRIRDYKRLMLIHSFVKHNVTEISVSVSELDDNSNYKVAYYWRGRITSFGWMEFYDKNQGFKKVK